MFTPQDLSVVKTIFFHSGCPDGIAAREIHRACFPDYKGIYIPYTFEDPLLGTEREGLLDKALFLDCHPKLDELERIFQTYQVWVADHHKTFENFVEAHSEFRDRIWFGDETTTPEAATIGCSGARLSYLIGLACSGNPQVDWKLLDAFSRMISIGDTWQTSNPDFPDARKLANFVHFFGNSYQGFHLPSDPIVQAFGGAQMTRNRSIAASALWRAQGGLRIAFISTKDTSDVGEILRNEQGADLVVGFEIKHAASGGEAINYSIRSRKGVSARRLAEFIGGGGHEQAAGCSTEYVSGRDPIQHLLECLAQTQIQE